MSRRPSPTAGATCRGAAACRAVPRPAFGLTPAPRGPPTRRPSSPPRCGLRLAEGRLWPGDHEGRVSSLPRPASSASAPRWRRRAIVRSCCVLRVPAAPGHRRGPRWPRCGASRTSTVSLAVAPRLRAARRTVRLSVGRSVGSLGRSPALGVSTVACPGLISVSPLVWLAARRFFPRAAASAAGSHPFTLPSRSLTDCGRPATARSVGRYRRFGCPAAALPALLPPVRSPAGRGPPAVIARSQIGSAGARLIAPPRHGHLVRTMAYPFTDPPLGCRTTHSQMAEGPLAPAPENAIKVAGTPVLGKNRWPYGPSKWHMAIFGQPSRREKCSVSDPPGRVAHLSVLSCGYFPGFNGTAENFVARCCLRVGCADN